MLTSCCRGSGAELSLLPSVSHPHASPREAGSAPGAREGSEQGQDFFLWLLGLRTEAERRNQRDQEKEKHGGGWGQKGREHTPNESFLALKKKKREGKIL